MSKKMKEVEQNGICVVSEEYLSDVEKGGGLVKPMSDCIQLMRKTFSTRLIQITFVPQLVRI